MNTDMTRRTPHAGRGAGVIGFGGHGAAKARYGLVRHTVLVLGARRWLPPTLLAQVSALARLVERGPDGLVSVKGGAYGTIAERRRSRP